MDDIIRHHGVLGMRWGVRRTAVQLGGEKRIKGSGDKAREKKKLASRPKPSPMTDEELRRRVDRLSLEKRYRDLEASLKPRRMKAVTRLLSDVGKRALNKVGDKVLDKVVDRALGDRVDSSIDAAVDWMANRFTKK